VWLGGTEPEWLSRLAATWRRHHPSWEMVNWTDENVDELFPLVNQRIFDSAPEIAPKHIGQLRSDVLRLEILQRFGGVYIDSDFECLKSIEPLTHAERPAECFAAWEVQNRWVNNAILGSTPKHPFIDALVYGLDENVRKHLGFKPNKLSGPQYVTRIHRDHVTSVTVFAQRLFYPYAYNELDRAGEQFEDAYAVHHWHNKRRETGTAAP
jgi:mannosyltransferase OCH1-like enzyme